MIFQAVKAFGFLLVLAAAARCGSRLAGRLLAVRDNELFIVSFLGAAVLIAGVSEFLGWRPGGSIPPPRELHRRDTPGR
jgi:CPA2 family monovalent cation:H+ antiporter-2